MPPISPGVMPSFSSVWIVMHRRQLVLALERIGSCHGVTTENAVNGARIKAGLFQAILDLQDEVT